MIASAAGGGYATTTDGGTLTAVGGGGGGGGGGGNGASFDSIYNELQNIPQRRPQPSYPSLGNPQGLQEQPRMQVLDPLSTLRAEPSARPSGTKKTKKKVKVIDAVVDATDEKVKRMKDKIKHRDQQIQMEEKELQTRAQRVKTIKTLKLNLESKVAVLGKKTKEELKIHYQSIIDRLIKDALISKFDTDMYQRVIVTTKPISIKRDGWLLAKEAGVYQIRIDFNESHYQPAIHILNITQSFEGYDSPTISMSRPCWGNIAGDIDNEFDTQDLYELVVDLIDYIRSPNTGAGYLSKDGDKSKGWEQFFDKAKKRSKNYSFDKLEENNELPEATMARWTVRAAELTMPSTTISMSTYEGLAQSAAPYSQQQNAIQQRQVVLENNMRALESLPPTSTPREGDFYSDPMTVTPRNSAVNMNRLRHRLYELGLRDEVTDVFAAQIIRSISGQNVTITILSIAIINDLVALTINMLGQDRLQISIDRGFIRPNIFEELLTHPEHRLTSPY